MKYLLKAWKRKQRRERGLSAIEEEDKAGSDDEEVDTAKDYQDLDFEIILKYVIKKYCFYNIVLKFLT